MTGASYSKSAEHFANSIPLGSSAVAQDAVNVVFDFAFGAAVLVALGAALCAPSFVAFVKTGGWPAIRRAVWTAAGLSVAALGATIPLLAWAHSLSAVQRNGGDHLYSGAFIGWVLLMTLTFTAWTVAGVTSARRLDLSQRVLRLERALALAVATLMVGVTVAAALWWESMANDAPWFLQGAAVGAPASGFSPNFVGTMTLMVVATAAGLYGATRVVSSWRAI